ncbi:MAG TPA: enoyl-CoA hydratase-related protein [Pseudonocardiaceae bacterium]|nr:enoyl-CoA hydratase-related protein [Pseudonocardiaceae bacterium]
MTGYLEITYDVADGVATIALHRPERRNGFTMVMSNELADALRAADADDDVRVVILTGHGNDFCVGADLSGGLNVVEEGSDSAYREPAGRVSLAIYAMNKPVIAALRGAAVGAGSTIILPADFRLAATDCRFGYVFARRGLVPEGASAWFLPRLVGLGRAMDWMVSGRVFGAEEALAAGLVTRLCAPDEVLPAAQALARELIATTAPVAVAVIRQLLFRMSPLDSPFPTRDLDSRLIADAGANPDVIEGVTSFLRKRPPEFPGRVSKDLPGYLPWLDRAEGGA